MSGLRFSSEQLSSAYNRVRQDLFEVGLLEEGRYLDAIECSPHYDPFGFVGEYGRVYDEGVGLLPSILGFEPGTIYVFAGAPIDAYVPGGTLVDVIRHEFAHAWAWLDAPFFRGRWFRDSFGAAYWADSWDAPRDFDRDDHVSEYACTQAKEDFAETFMVYLRYRRSLSRFDRRVGVRAKLDAIDRAVATAATTRVRTRRVPSR